MESIPNLRLLHPELLAANEALAAWLAENQRPTLRVLEGLRTLEENRAVNLAEYAMQMAEHRRAPWLLIDEPNKQQRTEELARMTERQLEHKATQRFSWHMVGCAISYSLNGLERAAIDSIVGWLRKQYEPPRFQVLVSEGCYFRAGTPFLRVERHDFCRRSLFDPRKATGQRTVSLSAAA